MNNKALTILNPRSFLGIFSDYGCSKTEKSVSFTDTDVQTFLEWEENQSTKRKTESYVFSGFGNGISRGWEQQSTAGAKLVELPLTDFGTAREIFLLSVRTKSIIKNFFEWKVCLLFFFVIIQRIFSSWIWMYDRTTVRPYKVPLLTCVVNCAAGTPTPRLCPVVQWSVHWVPSRTTRVLVLAGARRWTLGTYGKTVLGLAKSIYYTVNYRYGTLEEKFHINAHPYITLYFQHCT